MSCVGIFQKIEDCEGKSILGEFDICCLLLHLYYIVNTVIYMFCEKTWYRMDKHLTSFYVICSLFKSYKPECVPEKIPAVNIQVAFKAAGKMNPFFQQARLRLGAGNVDQGNAEMVKWNIDQGVKRVSVYLLCIMIFLLHI